MAWIKRLWKKGKRRMAITGFLQTINFWPVQIWSQRRWIIGSNDIFQKWMISNHCCYLQHFYRRKWRYPLPEQMQIHSSSTSSAISKRRACLNQCLLVNETIFIHNTFSEYSRRGACNYHFSSAIPGRTVSSSYSVTYVETATWSLLV